MVYSIFYKKYDYLVENTIISNHSVVEENSVTDVIYFNLFNLD